MTKSFISLTIDDYLLGIEVSAVREINRHVEIASVPLAPDFIAGLLNLRGQIVTIIDTGVKLGLSKRHLDKKARCVILKSQSSGSSSYSSRSMKDVTGLLIDNIGDIVTIDDSEIEPPPPNIQDINLKCVEGVVKLDNTLLLLISLNEILANSSRENTLQMN